MKDADDTDISGDSDTTDDEQNENEGDETGDNSDDNTTPDRENPDGDQNVSDDSEGEDQPSADGPNAGSGEELTDENKPAEEEAAEDADEVSDKVTVNDSSVNAVTPTAVTISVKQYEKDGTPATEEGGKATDRELTGSEKAAAVTFIDGTSADDSKALGGSRPVKFLLDMEDGWKEEGLAVTYSIPSDTDSQKKEKVSLSKGDDGAYTVPTNVDAVTGENPTPAGYSGNITIEIVAAATKSTVKLSAAADDKTVCLVKTDGTPDTDKTITDQNGQELDYAASTADVTLAVSGLEGKYRNIKVKVGDSGEEKPVYSSGIKPVGTGDAAKTYDLFTFNPSELKGFDKANDNEIIVTLGTSEAAHTLTLEDPGVTGAWAAGGVTPADSATNTAVTYITIDGSAFKLPDGTGAITEDNYINIGTADAPKKPVLAFTVTLDESAGLKLKGDKPVTAVLKDTSNKEVQVLEAKAVAATTGDDGVAAHYQIDLSTITAANFTGDLTLTVKVETEVNETAAGVHKISFAGDGLKNVTVGKKNDSKGFDELEDPYTAKMDDITIGVKPDAGYRLKNGTDFGTGGTSNDAVVKVSYDKVYALTTKAAEGAEAKDVKATIAVEDEELVVASDSDDAAYFAAAFEFQNSGIYEDADWKTDTTAKFSDGATAAEIDTGSLTDDKAEFTKENVVITVETEISGGKTGYVEIESEDADFVVSGDGITKSIGDTYWISEEATILTLTITSDVEPTVLYDETNGKTAIVKAGEAEGTYVAEIPVSELADGSNQIDDTIKISKGTKTLSVSSKTDSGAEETFTGKIYVNDKAFTNGDGITSGQKANVKIVAPVGTEFVSVSKVVGSDGEEEAVEVGEDKGAVTFEVTMTDDVTVNVALKSVFAATVEVGTEKAEQEEEGVYVIPAGSANIKVSLFKGDAGEAGNAEGILYAKVYDGNEIAATTATVANNVATISAISADDTGVLRVDLASKTTKKVEASVQIKQEKAASALEVKDAKNKNVTTVSVMADGEPAEFTVSAKDGRLEYAESNIGMEIVAKADDAAAATPVTENDTVKAEYADGKLTVTAKPATEGKSAAAVIRFYDIAKRTAAASDTAATDKLCLMADAITVNTTNPSVVGQKPVVKEAAGTPKTLKVELSTSDKVVAPKSVNKVFYKVTVEGTLAGTLTDADKVQYIEKTAWGKDSQIAEITVDNTVENVNDPATLGSAKDYSLKVELVQTTAQTAAPADWQAAVKAEAAANPTTLAMGGDKAIAELKKISTRDPLYETKLTMKPASVTVYTKQTLDREYKAQTQAIFDKKTGYTMVPYVQFVDTKTGVLLGDPSDKKDTGGKATYGREDEKGIFDWEATVDPNGNVKIGYNGRSTAAKNQPKNVGLKVTAVSPDGAYAASAIVKITVANGIEEIDFVSGDYRTIYKKSGKASLKLTPILNWGYKDQAPKKKTLTYAMGDATGKLPGEDGYSLNPEVASKVKVNAKNGQVSVDAKYNVANGGTFSVVAKAADYEGNTESKTVTIDITGEPQTLNDVVVVEALSGGSYKVIARDGGTLNAEDFYTYSRDNVLKNSLYVRALKPTAGTKRVYEEDDFVYGVSYASGAKAALSVATDDGRLDFIKPNTMPVQLTVSAADGSKSNKKISVTLKGFEKFGLEMFDSNNTHYDARELNHTYDGAIGEKFKLVPVAEMWDDFYKDCGGLGYTNINVTVKGAKIVRKLDGYNMDIVMTSTKATVTIADKTDKKNKTEYTITQEPAADAKAKAPGIKQIGSLTAADVTASQEGKDVKVAFQVTSKDKKYTPKNHARQYVLVTPDYTKTKEVNERSEWSRASSYFLNHDVTKIVQIDDNGQFKLDFSVQDYATFEIVPGTYTLIATVGTYSEGKFKPEAKGVNVKIKVPGKAAKNSLTVKGKYTLDAGATAPVDLASNKNIATDYDWKLSNAPTVDAQGNKNYAMNKIDPKTRKVNAFTTYFEVKEVKNAAGGVTGYTLGLKPGLTQDQINYITGSVAETKKDAKADCEGYVTVTSHNGYNDLMTKDMKITVTFKGAKYTAKTVESSVYEGADATVQIFETAKNTKPVKLAAAVIATDDKSGATLVTAGNGVEADGESIKVKFAAAGTYKVTLKVLAANSGYAAMTGATDLKAVAQANGGTVTATIKVSGKGDTTKNKVAVTGKAFKITANDFTTAAANTYMLDIPVKSAIEGTTIAAATVPATVKDKDYEGRDIVSAAYTAATGKVTLTVKRDKLIEANAAKGGKFKFGKAVDVPVTFTFTDTAVTAETVTLKVTLPNPMTFEKAVETAKKLEDTIGGMYDDLLFADADEMKADLEGRINAVLENALPKDVQAAVCSRNITLADVAATDKTPAGYKATVTVQKAATKAEGDYEKEYTFTKGEVYNTTADTLGKKISALTADDLEQLGNDYTPEKLLADVKKALTTGENAVKIPANLSLSVDKKTFALKKATAKTGGSLKAKILIRDRNDSENTKEAEMNVTIAKLGTLSDASADVKAALAEYDADTEVGLNYNAIISNALGTDGSATGVEAALKTAIENAAKAAIKNPDITVKGFKKTELKSDSTSDHPSKPTDAGTKVEVDVDFKLPAGGTDGSVSFKLVLAQEGMKDLEVDCSNTTVTAKTFTSMTVTGQDVSGETPTDLVISSNKVSLTDVEGAKSLKFTAEVKGTQLTDDDKKVTFALVKQADTEGLEGENLTLDDIPAATLPAGVTLTTNPDGTVTLNVAANAAYGADDNKITLYLRASKNLKKLYASDETEITETDRTKVYTIELTKKAATPAP